MVLNLEAAPKQLPTLPPLKPNPMFYRSNAKVLGAMSFLPENVSNVRLGDVITSKAQVLFEMKSDTKPISMATVGDKMWVLQVDNILERLDADGQSLNQCKLPENSDVTLGVELCREICNFQGELVIAAKNGLFLCEGDQKITSGPIDWTLLQITAEDYVSVTSYDTFLFALTRDGLVQVFVRSSKCAHASVPDAVDSFKPAHYDASNFNRIRASGTCIFLSLFHSGAVRSYSHDGKLLSSVCIPFPEVLAQVCDVTGKLLMVVQGMERNHCLVLDESERLQVLNNVAINQGVKYVDVIGKRLFALLPKTCTLYVYELS